MKICREIIILHNFRHCLKKSCIKENFNSKNNVLRNILYMCRKRNYSSSVSLPEHSSRLFTMKIDSPAFHSIFTPELKKLGEMFKSKGYDLRVTGGAVRDILGNIQPVDVDFATTASPEQMKDMFDEEKIRIITLKGERYGTFPVRINDKQNFEITTLRINFFRNDKNKTVKFVNDWCLDASRRDLTINAMYLGLDGTLYDYFNGVEDLKNKRIQFVGNPEERIQEDYLRILRYFRFYGQIADHPNEHEPQILKDIEKNVSGLSVVSSERIVPELRKILSGKHNFDLLRTMVNLGIAPYIGLPNNPDIKKLEALQNRTVNLKLQPVTILSSLIENKDQMKNLWQKLKFSNEEAELGFFLIHYREEKFLENSLKPYQKLILEANSKQIRIIEGVEEVLKYRGEKMLFDQFKNWKIPKFPVTGKFLLSHGVMPGNRERSRRFNRILTALKNKWIESDFTMTKEQLIEKLPGVINEDNLQHSSDNLDFSASKKK